VSLILDALKKLERDRDSREPGVLVVGSVPWGERRRSRRPLALASLGLVALAFAGWWWWRPAAHPPVPAPASVQPAPASSPPLAASPTPPSATRVPSSGAVAPLPRRLAVPTLGETNTPPTPPEETPAAAVTRPAPDDLRLNAIARRDGRPVALINDRLVFEGDSFDGVRILRIGEAEVEVEVRGKRRVLRFE
jgi:hypothetical protein